MHQGEAESAAAANFGIVRYLKNYGKENNIGIMATHRLNEKNSGLGLNSNSNITLSVDGFNRPTDELTISYLASGSYDETSNTNGLAGNVFAGYTTNKMYWGWLTNFVSRDYNPGMGFVFQNNVIQHNPGGYFILRPEKTSWIRRWDPGVFFNYFHDFENPANFQQGSIYLFPIYTWFKDNSFVQYSVTPTWQNINFDFSPLGIDIGQQRYYYTRQAFEYNTDRSRKLSANVEYGWGGFYNGKRSTIIGGIRYAPIPHAAFQFDYEHNNLKDVGLLEENLKTDLYTASLRLALNPRLQLSTFYQYNSFDEQGRWNVRFSWEYMPLSFIYLVFNDTQTNSFDLVQQTTQFISKLTFLKQF